MNRVLTARRRTLRSAVIAASLSLALLMPTASWAATDDPEEPVDPGTSWQVQPSGPDGPGLRTYFVYRSEPGEWVEDVVAITNHSESEITLGLFATDALNVTESGAFDLLPTAELPADIGQWVQLPTDRVTVPPRSRIDVPFLLHVPDDASPGDHVGGIVTSLVSEGQDDQGNNVLFDARVAVRIYASVSGEIYPSLVVEDLETEFLPDANQLTGTMWLSYTIHNAGNIRLGVRENVAALPIVGPELASQETEDLAELLPGGRMERVVELEGVPALIRLSGEVTVGMVDVGGLVTGEDAGEIGVVEARSGVWAVPWIALLVAGALGTILFVVIRGAVRRWRRMQAELADARATLSADGEAGSADPVEESAPQPEEQTRDRVP